MLTGVIIGLVGGLVIAVMTVVSRSRAQRRRQIEGPPAPPSVDVPAGHGTVVVRRLSVGMSASMLTFDVVVDDVTCAQVRSDAAVAIPLPPGPHTVRVAKRRISSPVLSFDVTPGATVTFDCEYVAGAFSGSIALRPAG